MSQQLLDWITFSYDDATRRKLLILYKQKDSLLDSEVLQEHLLCQPLLGALLFAIAVFSLGSFIFAVIFIACRALGNCGAKRYQLHPPNGHRYVIYLAMILISWIGLAGSTIHFVGVGAVLWNSPTEIDRHVSGNSVLQHQKHVISRRDNTEKTVRQLFEDSDYAGDFEELDPTTASHFVTEKPKTGTRPSTPSETKQSKKQGDSKSVKWFRRIGQSPGAANAASSAISQFFLLESKLNTERDSRTTVKPVSLHNNYLPRRKQTLTYPNRGGRTVKTISQPFVSDTWSNAGKQAFYRHELSPSMSVIPDSPPTTLLVDNSVIRTDAPVLTVPELREVAELETIQRNIIASEVEGMRNEVPSSYFSSVTTSTTAVYMKIANEPENTTKLTFASSGSTRASSTTDKTTTTLVTQSKKIAEASFTTGSEKLKDERMLNNFGEMKDDLETSTNTSSVAQGDDTTAESSTGLGSLTSSPNPATTSAFELTTEWNEDPLTIRTATASATDGETTTPLAVTKKVTTTTSATTSSAAVTKPATTATAAPTTTSRTTTTLAARATPSLIITRSTILEEGTTKPSQNKSTETSQSRSTTTSTLAYTIMGSEEERNYPAIARTIQVDATAAMQPYESTSEDLVIMKVMREGQLTWPGRIFVFFIAIIMVLLTAPTPMLITAGARGYARGVRDHMQCAVPSSPEEAYLPWRHLRGCKFLPYVVSNLGTVCYMRSYHPMDRTTFSDKVGQMCVVLATVLLFVIPCVCLCLNALLAYIHVYFAFCSEIQAVVKIQSLNVPVLADRITNGPGTVQMCQRNPEMSSLRDIWLACFSFVLFSCPTIFALFKLSKYYLRMKTEYYWNTGDGYGVIRPKVATINDAIYGNIYGTLQVQKKRPASKPPPRPAEPAAYGVYIEQPIYGAFR